MRYLAICILIFGFVFSVQAENQNPKNNIFLDNELDDDLDIDLDDELDEYLSDEPIEKGVEDNKKLDTIEAKVIENRIMLEKILSSIDHNKKTLDNINRVSIDSNNQIYLLSDKLNAVQKGLKSKPKHDDKANRIKRIEASMLLYNDLKNKISYQSGIVSVSLPPDVSGVTIFFDREPVRVRHNRYVVYNVHYMSEFGYMKKVSFKVRVKRGKKAVKLLRFSVYKVIK